MKKTVTIIASLVTFMMMVGLEGNQAVANEINFAVKGGYFQYREPGADVDYSGAVTGIEGSYKKQLSKNYAIRVQSQYMQARTTYDGHVNNHQIAGGSTITNNVEKYDISYDSDMWYSDSNIAMGKRILKNNFQITPYIGIGYRYLKNPGKPEIAGDYEREVTYLYLPLGVELKKDISKSKGWGITGEIDILVHGWVKAHTSEISEKCNDLEFNQSKGGALKISGFYHQHLFGQAVSVSPFAELWVIGDSDTDALLYDGTRMMVQSADGELNDYREPYNVTMSLGLRISVLF